MTEADLWKVLYIDDDEEDYLLTRGMLRNARRGHFMLDWGHSYQDGIDKLMSCAYDAVLVDYNLGSGSGVELIRSAIQQGCQVPFLLITGQGSLEVDLDAMQAGAVDYLVKNDLNAEVLERSIRYAMERKRIESDLEAANQKLVQAYSELNQERTRLNTLIQHAPSGILLTDEQGNILYVNPVAEQILNGSISGTGYLPEGSFSLHRLDGSPFPPEELPLAQSLQMGKVVENVEVLVRHRNDHEIIILKNSSPIRDEEGRISGAVAVMQDITRNKRAEETLRQSEERFRLASRAVNGIVYEWDLITGREFRSEGVEKITGVPADQASSDRSWWIDRIHPDDRPAMENLYMTLLQNPGESHEHEYRIRHEAGHWVYVWDRSYLLRDAEGRLVRLIGTTTDITERKRSEQNARFLAELGEKFMTLEDPEEVLSYAAQSIANHLEASRCLIDDIDQDKQLITILSEYHAAPPVIAGSYPFRPWHAEAVQVMNRGKALVIPDTATHPLTREFYESSFKAFDFRSYMMIPRLVDGRWQGTLVVSDDQPRSWRADEISLLKQVSDLVWLALRNSQLMKNLREAQNRLEVALKNSDITVYTTDLERRYTWIHNMRLGLEDFGLVGRRDEEVFNADTFAEIIRLKEEVLKSGTGVRKEVRLNVLGQPVYLDMTIEPLRDAEGQVTGLIVAEQDTTRRRQMEDQMRETADNIAVQREIIKHREEERIQIARNLHDGPIQNLISLLFTIQIAESISSEQEVIEVLKSLREETQKLVAELRSVCNELRPPILAQFGLAKAIRSHADEFREKHKDLKFHLELMEDGRTLPDGVRLALYRVYQESLNNIIRHSQASEVTVKLSMEPDRVRMEIRDNGIGFESPTDWVSLARQGHLGLVGMKERVEAVHGKMTVNARPGGGTSILLTVPRQANSAISKAKESLKAGFKAI